MGFLLTLIGTNLERLAHIILTKLIDNFNISKLMERNLGGFIIRFEESKLMSKQK